MNTPSDILLARALSHLERASLELQTGNVEDGADYLTKGMALLEEVLGR